MHCENHYEIHAPEFGVLHPMVCIEKADTFESALHKFEQAKLKFLYVRILKVTTIKEIVKEETPNANR